MQKRLDDLPIDYSLQILKKMKEAVPPLLRRDFLPYQNEDPRLIYIWSKINLLEQQVMLLFYHKEFVDSLSPVPDLPEDTVTENILFTVYDSLAVSTRKTLETILELKGFVKYDHMNLYRIYYCRTEIEDKQRHQEDRSTYFKAYSKNIERQIDLFKSDLETYLEKSPEKSVFFLISRANPEFTRIPDLLKRVLSLLTPEESQIVGYSYQVYSDLSTRLHSRMLPKNELITINDINVMYAYLGLLILHTIAVLAELIPEIESNHLNQIKRLLKNNQSSKELHHRYSNNDIKKDDYVIAMRRLARVTKVNKSSYGYYSYTVKFIENPPIEDQLEDTFKPMELRFWADGGKHKEEVIKYLGKDNAKGKVNKKLIQDSLDKGALKLMQVLREANRSSGRN